MFAAECLPLFYFDVQLMQNISAAVLHVNKLGSADHEALLKIKCDFELVWDQERTHRRIVFNYPVMPHMTLFVIAATWNLL